MLDTLLEEQRSSLLFATKRIPASTVKKPGAKRYFLCLDTLRDFPP